jgi:tetratricopeptide (TPR) repeat protein
LKSLKRNEDYRKAKDLFDNSNYKSSLVILNEIIETEADDKDLLSKAFFLLANIFHIRGEIGRAIKGFNKCLSLDPSHTDAAISLSVLYNDIGQYEEAKKIFDTANERVKTTANEEFMEDGHINKKFADKHFELAEMYFTYNRLDEALFEYNKVRHLTPSDLEVRIKIAKTYAKKSFINKAFDELKALKLENPNYIPARIALGVLYYGSGKILEAQSEWEKTLTKDPRNEEALMYLNLSRTATETTLA